MTPFQEKLLSEITRLNYTQRKIAETLGVSLSLVEAWLCDSFKSWHKTPNHLETVGILSILKNAQPHGKNMLNPLRNRRLTKKKQKLLEASVIESVEKRKLVNKILEMREILNEGNDHG